jgi:hypothetical protein
MTQKNALCHQMAVSNPLSNLSTLKYVLLSLESKNEYLLKSTQNNEVTL